eukprot:CAMPEP_0185622530 /NCGR_PEP_ID=MMETSP0436-20130131/59289_1 /TAXON_ID=626734 ORGANISM="Favella taraikaensis, Strain Fe Narragansett Bay" /NCGR_SAMPLE_ID=MMETSP0436 /ASSEMBLY_ACC=CAM_ASM_000390 /LENGTH=133 /DNA_ID=CAMNT_0028264303 /DNA_START=666 /DNA_END=1065 /DNA_ORIENTATION=-
MTKLIAEIANSLDQTRQQALMFRRAAYYDSSQANAADLALKDGGAKLGADHEAFQRLLDGEVEENAADGAGAERGSQQHGARQSTTTEDNWWSTSTSSRCLTTYKTLLAPRTLTQLAVAQSPSKMSKYEAAAA